MQPDQTQQRDVSLKSKLPYILLGFVLVVFVGGGAYFLGARSTANPNSAVQQEPNAQLPTPTQTTPPIVTSSPSVALSPTTIKPTESPQWKKYANSFGKYSIEYPATWIYKSEERLTNNVSLVKFESSDYRPDDSPGAPPQPVAEGSYLMVRVEENSNFKSYDDYINFIENGSTAYAPNYKNKQEITLANGKCLLLSDAESRGDHISYCFTWRNGKSYDFWLTSTDSKENLLKQILSTLKFTE
jgi:hypothetical protein